MLNVLRQSVKDSPYLKWVLLAVGLGLVAYLGNYFTGNQPGGVRGDWVARVNGAEIPERQFREAARNLDRYYSQLLGESYEQIKPQLQIPQLALQAIVEKELVLQDARGMGLRCSPSDIAEQIRTHPSFQDEYGQFVGRERYVRMVSTIGGFEVFERSLEEDLLTERWTNLVTQPVNVTQAELEELFRKRTEKTAIDFVLVASADQKIDIEIPEAELQSWYATHLDDYQRDEGRRIRYLVVDRESRQDAAPVSDEAIREYYTANEALYAHPEQRRVSHILLRLPPGTSGEERAVASGQAESILQRLQNGEDFAALARSLSEDADSADKGGDLGFIGRGEMFEAFEQAAFDTAVGEIAPVTQTPHGLNIIKVMDRRDAGVTPLAEVEAAIRRTLSARAADEQVAADAQSLHAEIGSPDQLQAVAEREGLTLESRFFTARDGLPELGASREFIDSVAAAEPGSLAAPLRVANGMAIVAVDSIVPPGPAPLEDVRAAVSTAVLNERTREAALNLARSTLDGSSDLAAAARSLGLDAPSNQELSPDQAPPGAGGTSDELSRALFSADTQTGQRGVVSVPTGALIYEVTRREPFDPARFELEKNTLRDEALRDRRERYRQSVIEKLRARNPVEVNPVWLETYGQTS